jgi:hypothetical protein
MNSHFRVAPENDMEFSLFDSLSLNMYGQIKHQKEGIPEVPYQV